MCIITVLSPSSDTSSDDSSDDDSDSSCSDSDTTEPSDEEDYCILVLQSFVLCVFLFSTFSLVLSKIHCHSLFGLAEEMTSSVEI